LVSLELKTNFIGPEGAVALADMLCSNTTLMHLSLSDNNIGDQAVAIERAIVKAVEANTTLQTLDLTYNGLSSAVTETLLSAKERSDSRREVPLDLRL